MVKEICLDIPNIVNAFTYSWTLKFFRYNFIQMYVFEHVTTKCFILM